MESLVVSNLIAGSFIKPGSEVLVKYHSSECFSVNSQQIKLFNIVRFTSKDNNIYLLLKPKMPGEKSVVATPDQILEVDGMSQERLLKAFNLQSNGLKKPRKRKQ